MLSLLLFGSILSQNNEKLDLLKNYMTGSFSSADQAAADTNFFDIRLEMKQIWNERNDAIYLYVEQAASWALDKPYRQRIYKVVQTGENSFESAVYTFENPLRFAGAFREDNPLSELTPDSLLEREGCAIMLEYSDGKFTGSTVDKNCGSDLRGASYATSEVEISENVLTSWDRGFDSEDRQVWGAITGPYIFKKK
ncbi:MAG: chromophore lyase CpcT/CpeT 1 [Melioribacteraceae bacterium]|nr:MAG: chromophore lyase CpcT/CpeT 1 [Melioribacteraceae bacterium]